MHAIVNRSSAPTPRLSLAHPPATRTAELLFSALAPLHRLSPCDAALLHRAAAGLRLIRSGGEYSPAERALFDVALAELSRDDAWDVEDAACLAADSAPPVRVHQDGRKRRRVANRAIWFAAILRLADALCTGSASEPSDVYATWTDEHLYLECDGAGLRQSDLSNARDRAAALEAVTERRLVLASATSRRGAA